MPYLKRPERYTKIMESNFIFSVSDVYDLAADIGFEFEKIIELYGIDSVSKLVNIISRALERLESQTISRDRLENELSELKLRVAQFENAKHERAGNQEKFERELEQIEEQWRKESSNLTEQVQKLKEENKRLNRSNVDSQSCEKCLLQTEANLLVENLQSAVNKLQTQLNSRERDLKKASDNLESSQNQLKEMNSLLRNQVRQLQDQVHQLIEERSILQVQLIRLSTLQDNMAGSPTEDDLAEVKIKGASMPFSEVKKIIWERDDLLKQIKELKNQMAMNKSTESLTSLANSNQACGSLPSSDTSSVIDMPVQGPINKEPFEKLYPGQRGGGVKRFFRFLLGKKPENQYS